jgi:peptidoglycan/LPS O-acetylase OafA/YrhL
MIAIAIAACYPLADPVHQQPWPNLTRALLLGAGSYALILATFSGQGRLAGALSLAPLRWLGNCSYSFYLAHSLGVHAAEALAARLMPAAPWQGLGFWLTLIAAALAASVATLPLYLFVERPFSLRKPALRAG